jgi:hypothetical protein
MQCVVGRHHRPVNHAGRQGCTRKGSVDGYQQRYGTRSMSHHHHAAHQSSTRGPVAIASTRDVDTRVGRHVDAGRGSRLHDGSIGCYLGEHHTPQNRCGVVARIEEVHTAGVVDVGCAVRTVVGGIEDRHPVQVQHCRYDGYCRCSQSRIGKRRWRALIRVTRRIEERHS